ncbi:hypothetical protein DPMN_081256 [Dreissena polymorpha]|uniref:Uncharacterized protein n=1 Tax=Dreissena polymorpha TaxID=45954 RepID=A0A9D4BHK8_DREPO|nr:hypothetical protein DPMN_081256 [Dreissena polymorpha]
MVSRENQTYEVCKTICSRTYNGSLAKMRADFVENLKPALMTNFTYKAWTEWESDTACHIMKVTPTVVRSYPDINCSHPAICICEKLTPTTGNTIHK